MCSGRTRRARWALSLQPPPTLKATAHAHRRCTDRYPHCSERSLHLGRDACRMLHAAWLYVSCNVHVALVAGCLCATNSAARLQNATQVQSDTAVLVPGLVGSKVRENSIDSSTHSAAVASQNRHAAFFAACIATDSLCAHNRTAPHSAAPHGAAPQVIAVASFYQHSAAIALESAGSSNGGDTRRVVCVSPTASALRVHCTALRCTAA